MEWMNISYILAFLAVFVASASQILLKQSAETEHKNIITKFLNWRVILGYGLLFGTTVLNVFAYRGIELEVTPMIEATGIIWVTLLAASIFPCICRVTREDLVPGRWAIRFLLI